MREANSEYTLRLRDFPVGAQMLFVAFGALVLVPLLTGLDPNVSLFCAGSGTLLYQVLTGFRIPIFLGSSFAFIAPIMAGIFLHHVWPDTPTSPGSFTGWLLDAAFAEMALGVVIFNVMLLGSKRSLAAEYSFIAAVPIMGHIKCSGCCHQKDR